MSTRSAALLLGWGLATALAPGYVQAQAVTLRIEAAGRTVEVHGRTIDGAPAFPIETLRDVGAAISVDAGGAGVLLLGDSLVFRAGSPFFARAGTVHQLAFAVRRVDGRLFLPEQFFVEWLPRRYDAIEFAAGTLHARGVVTAQLPAGQRVVIIDPGHGGVDPGKVGVNGLREKDLTLLIGQLLRAQLQQRGYEVHMTRTADTLIALADRPRMANQAKAGRASALFLSIHGNSAPSAAAAGFETFFLAEARTEDERRVAEMENAAVRFETNGEAMPSADIDYILMQLRNEFYQRASNDLAESVQRQLAAFHPGRNRGVKQAPFRVLVGAFMPAVLIEVGFLSNAAEARLLGTAAFQQKLAWAIADAVDRFFDEHEHLLITDSR